jgi:hypothetical protein
VIARRGFLGALLLAPLALVACGGDDEEELDEEGRRVYRGGVVDLPHGGTVTNCTFEGVQLRVGGPAHIGNCAFRMVEDQGAAVVVDHGASIRGVRA